MARLVVGKIKNFSLDAKKYAIEKEENEKERGFRFFFSFFFLPSLHRKIPKETNLNKTTKGCLYFHPCLHFLGTQTENLKYYSPSSHWS